MNYCSFDTTRLKCRSLTDANFADFSLIVTTDSEIPKYFYSCSNVTKLADFYASIINGSNSFNVGIFDKRTSILIGYINGYIYSSDELLVEFFISKHFRHEHYAYEALNGYMEALTKFNYFSFRFWVEPENNPSIALLKKLSAKELKEEAFLDEKIGKFFNVYKIYR